jgi:putative ABC transport system ATP-binding protein
VSAVIECRDVSRQFTGGGAHSVLAVDSVNLDVEPGTFVSIEGPSGSGKTTLLGLLAGIEPPDSGSITIIGHELGRLTLGERARLRRLRIGIVFQSFGLVASLTVAENVALPLALDNVDSGDRARRAGEALASVGLADVAEKRIDELSGGQRQRVGVARALVAEPALVLADEPTGSLDDQTATDVLRLLRDRTRAIGASLVLVTHDAASAALADERYAMLDGKLARIA